MSPERIDNPNPERQESPPELEGIGEQEGAEQNAAEGARRGILAGLASKAWERIPGFDAKAARERLSALKPSEMKKIFSDGDLRRRFGWEALVLLSGAGGGQLAGRITRYGLGALTGGAGWAAAVVGGGLAGATAEGLKTYLRERKREISRDEFVEKAIQYRKKESRVLDSLDKSVRTEETEEGEEITTIRERTRREEKIGAMKARLDYYLKLTSDEEIEKETNEGKEINQSERNALYRELKKEFGARKSEVLRAMGRGAIVGAVGGVAGEALMRLLGWKEYANAAKNLQDAAKAAAKSGKDATVNEALCNQMTAAAQEANARALERAMKAAPTAIYNRNFGLIVGNGEGATHIARKAIHDYIVEQTAVGNQIRLSDARLVFAEDWLMKNGLEGGQFGIGDEIRVAGRHIGNAIYEAENLTEEQARNLEKEWVPKISEKTWERIKDYSALSNPENNFSKGILEAAKREGARAMRAETARCAREAAQGKLLSEAAEKAAREWWMKVAIGGLIAAGTGAAAWYFLRRKIKSGGAVAEAGTEGEPGTAPALGEEEEISVPSSDLAAGAMPAAAGGAAGAAAAAAPEMVPETEKPEVPPPGGAPEKKRKNWRDIILRRGKKKGGAVPRGADHEAAAEAVQPAGDEEAERTREEEVRRAETAVAAEREAERIRAAEAERRAAREQEQEREREEAALQRKLERAGVPEDLRSRSIEEEERKREADQSIQAVRDKGIEVEKGSYSYRVPDVRDMGKQSGIREIFFPSYSDYRAYLERMTPDELNWARRIVYTYNEGKENERKEKMMGVWSRFWDAVNALPEEQKRDINDRYGKVLNGVAADEFRGKPEITIELLRDVQNRLNREFSRRRGAIVGSSPWDISALHVYGGMETLINVFQSLPADVNFGGRAVIRIDKKSACERRENDRNFDWEILLDPSLSEGKMKEHLIKASETIKRAQPPT